MGLKNRRAWTGFGWLTMITRGEMSGTTNPATHSPDRNIPYRVLWSKIRPQTSTLHITEKYIKYRSRPNKYIGPALPSKRLRPPLCSPIKEMFRSHSRPLLVSRSRQCRNPPSTFPSRSLFKRKTYSISNAFLDNSQ
jgi:hypothetical protein